MKIAIQGCAHGELEKIYNLIEYIECKKNYKIDLLICCGDFQATRNLDDLETMAVPKKFQDMCSFYKYYSGEKVAPVLTLFIGGNHEASNYLQELPYGGWVAPNIYYLGYAGIVNVNGIRIGGISGIYNSKDYFKGHFEYPPYNESTRRSVYHTRQLEVFRLKQISDSVDIFISHDWPRRIYRHGDFMQLIQFKPHFRQEIEDDTLGSPPCEDLLNALKPNYWFAAHLHCKFSAVVPHDNSEKVTRFLALDKCLPRRRFLQILEIGPELAVDERVKLEYDLEWLTILSLTNHLTTVKNVRVFMPGPNGCERYNFIPNEEEKEHVRKKMQYDMMIPDNFKRTVEYYMPENNFNDFQQPKPILNPQTVQFCDLLGIDDPLTLSLVMNGQQLNYSSNTDESYTSFCINSVEESSINSSQGQISPLKRAALSSSLPKPINIEDSNLEEIDIDDLDEKTSHSIPTDANASISDCTSNVTESTDCDSLSISVKPPIKKFKRRNQQIYAANEEE